MTSSMDFGLLGLDVLGNLDKSLDVLSSYGSDVQEFQDILNLSIEESGIGSNQEVVTHQDTLNTSSTTWEDDEFLKSMLTGSDLGTESLGLGSSETVLSDTSSDSGVVEDRSRMLISPGLEDGPRMLMSPGLDSPLPGSPAHSLDIIDYISNDSDSGDTMLSMDPTDGLLTTMNEMTRPVSNNNNINSNNSISIDPVISTTTGTTTIILPAIGTNHTTIGSGMTFSSHRLAPRDPGPATKRRRVSASSSDSGLEDSKYPRLELNDEERKMASKEGMTFPKFYPLTREEERNLKKIRRKIRNKVSAQDSRKRKREYLDSMEDRVKDCTDENKELKDKLKALESQNKTLAAQLRRLHQIIVNGGSRQGQTSTALMVLLLSTALFLIPGVRDQTETKPEIDIQAAVKMPPMPGQSRSLLAFQPIAADRNTDIADMADFEEEVKVEPVDGGKVLLHLDHDYTATSYPAAAMKIEPGKQWIDEDAPPLGYGSAVKEEEEDRHMNVNVTSSGQGTRTVVLQIPKDIK